MTINPLSFRELTRSIVSVCVLLCFLPVLYVDVADAKEDPPARKTKRVESIPQSLVKDFEKLGVAFEEENIPEARRLITKLEGKKQLNNISRAYLANFKGNIYFSEDNLDGALREFKKIIALKEGVPEAFTSQIRYVIAQVYFSKENFREALNYAQGWFASQTDPSADAYLLIGQAQFMLKRYDDALPNVQKGIDKYKAAGAQPKESWLNLLAGIYREKRDFKKMLPVLKQLVAYYPKKTYLDAMAGVFNELGDTGRMTAIFQALYDQGLMVKESEVVTLASLHLSQDNPYKAARIFEKGLAEGVVSKSLKNYRLYSQSLYLSREYQRALDPLNKAAKLAEDGTLYNQLGQSYLALERWKEAEDSLKIAINKGKLRNKEQTYIALGTAQFEQKKFSQAKQSFKKALSNDKTRRAAENWSKYIDSEVRRIKELEKPIEINTDVQV